MKYLLDVNALIAYGFRKHGFHRQVGSWIQSKRSDSFLTCSITELGFVRVLGNVRTYGIDAAHARALLATLKSNTTMPLDFLTDGDDISALPAWVKTPAKTTDGHLAQLARTHNAVLATFDKGIPGAYLIP